MHQSSLEKMRSFVEKYLGDRQGSALEILDLGGADIGGTYRQYFHDPAWRYRGMDLVEGPNIDITLSNPYNWREIPTNSADVFISGQTFEHIEFVWLTMLEIARILKPGGLCCIIAPSTGPIHRYPVDCWRFYPDGFAALARYADLDIVEILHDEVPRAYPDQSEMWRDLMLVARKKTHEPTREQEYARAITLEPNDSLTKIIQQVASGSTVLELGPAKGYLTRHLVSELGCTVDCVELSASMAEEVRPIARQLIVGDLNTLDLRSTLHDAEYDVIIAADVLEHLAYTNTVIAQAFGLLKDGGIMLVSVPNIAHASVIGALCQGEFPYAQDGLLDTSHTRFFTKRSICRELNAQGFCIERIDPVFKAPHETELGDTPGDLPLALEEYLRELPDAMAYQFIITARKGIPVTHVTEVPNKQAIQTKFIASLFSKMTDQEQYFEGHIERQRQYFEQRHTETVAYYEEHIERLKTGLEEAKQLAFTRQKELVSLSEAFRNAEGLALGRMEELHHYSSALRACETELAEIRAKLQEASDHPWRFLFNKLTH